MALGADVAEVNAHRARGRVVGAGVGVGRVGERRAVEIERARHVGDGVGQRVGGDDTRHAHAAAVLPADRVGDDLARQQDRARDRVGGLGDVEGGRVVDGQRRVACVGGRCQVVVDVSGAGDVAGVGELVARHQRAQHHPSGDALAWAERRWSDVVPGQRARGDGGGCGECRDMYSSCVAVEGVSERHGAQRRVAGVGDGQVVGDDRAEANRATAGPRRGAWSRVTSGRVTSSPAVARDVGRGVTVDVSGT